MLNILANKELLSHCNAMWSAAAWQEQQHAGAIPDHDCDDDRRFGYRLCDSFLAVLCSVSKHS